MCVMEEKRARAAEGEADAEAAESPRKSSRLEPQPDSAGEESAAAAVPGDTDDGEQCGHLCTSPDELSEILAHIEDGMFAAKCDEDGCWVFGRRRILVCTECNSLRCAGLGAEGKPRGHAWSHAESDGHHVALWYDDPSTGYCFVCDRNMNYSNYVKHGEGIGESLGDGDDGGGYSGEKFWLMVRGTANGHGYAAEGMLNHGRGGHAVGDPWLTVTGTANEHGYPVKGMRNHGNTCYLNALLQCLLVLGKLRERMLGPETPSGVHAILLQDLFAEANRADNEGHTLDPFQLLQCVRSRNSRFEGNHMQDSHELLMHLLNTLGEEEKENPRMQKGAPTVADSIFGGQLDVTRSCNRCLVRSISHEVFCDLSVPLPSKATSAHSVASSSMDRGRISQTKIHMNLYPATASQRINTEKNQVIAESADSQIPGSKVEDVLMEKTPKPLDVGSTEVDVVRGPFQTRNDDDPGEIIEVPVKEADFFPHNVLFDAIDREMDETTADSCSSWGITLPPLVSPSREKNERMVSVGGAKQNHDAGLDEASIEVENAYPIEVTTEDKGKAWSSDNIFYDKADDMSSLASLVDYLALHFKTEGIERFCENCLKVAEPPSTNTSEDGEQMMASASVNTTVDPDRTEQSDRKTCQNRKSGDLNILAVERTSSSKQMYASDAQQHKLVLAADRTTGGISSRISYCEDHSTCCITTDKNLECEEAIQEAVPSSPENQTNLSSAQDSQNASTQNHNRGKQVKLDHSAQQAEENQNEQKNISGYATETCLFSKLPPVLIIHLKRSLGPMKVTGHVRFKEILDVGGFMDHSSEDKDNSRYRLVGVIEHCGGRSADFGHYVAYVRPSHQQLSTGSSSWFCANDTNIRKVSLEQVLMCEAYMLFYERMEG